MLIENTLFGIENKIDIAIQRIKSFEPIALNINPNGYYVCISGGKDSSVIQELCLMAGVKCEFFHNHTTVDHPETVYFIRKEKKRMTEKGYNFNIEYARYRDGKMKTMWNMIPSNGLPTRIHRWCCRYLKEYGGIGRYCITGVRWEESSARKNNRGLYEESGKDKTESIILNNDNDIKRRLSESCLLKRKFILNPIIDWKEYEIWDFIKLNKLPYNPLYDLGFKRVGCIGCPMSDRTELENNPKYKAAYMRAAEKRIAYRKEKELNLEKNWKTGLEYFNWWING